VTAKDQEVKIQHEQGIDGYDGKDFAEKEGFKTRVDNAMRYVND